MTELNLTVVPFAHFSGFIVKFSRFQRTVLMLKSRQLIFVVDLNFYVKMLINADAHELCISSLKTKR